MLKHFEVKNFRCFASLRLDQLERVNLIAGKNNTGKTSLLEAIHLHNNPGDLLLPVAINKIRGVPDPAKAVAEVCAWLFHEERRETGLEATSLDEKGITRTLKVSVLDPKTSRERFPGVEKVLTLHGKAGLGMATLPRLILESGQFTKLEGAFTGVAGIVLGDNDYAYIGERTPVPLPSVYLGSAAAAPGREVQFFGELELAKRQGEILPALQILEPRLQRLSLAPLAGEPVIHGDIGLPRLVPMPFMGEGTRRVLSILLAIANSRGGVVLIDEIENGLHWSVQQQVWRAVGDAARRNDVQVFATTHSWESIRYADAAFSEDGCYDFRLHRIDRLDGRLEVVSYTKEMIEASLISGLEMR